MFFTSFNFLSFIFSDLKELRDMVQTQTQKKRRSEITDERPSKKGRVLYSDLTEQIKELKEDEWVSTSQYVISKTYSFLKHAT